MSYWSWRIVKFSDPVVWLSELWRYGWWCLSGEKGSFVRARVLAFGPRL